MQNESEKLSRRSFLKESSVAAAGASAFTIIKPELVRGAGKEKLKAGVIGCGGRGTGAVVNLLSGDPHVELVAMADLFEDKLETSIGRLRDNAYVARMAKEPAQLTNTPIEKMVASIQQRVKAGGDSRHTGLDGYKKVIAADLDIVLLTTPPGWRPIHFEAAIEAGKHVFTEKPIATDPAGTRRFLAANRKAQEKKLTVMSGAQRRSSPDFVETIRKIHDGALGEVLAAYSNYLSRPVIHAKARDPKWADAEWQHRNWYAFVWLCGDQIVEQHFHNIDCINWALNGHPVKVVASGGAAWRTRDDVWGNIYDHLTSDFVYANGVHYSSSCRQLPEPTYRDVSDLVVGAKGRSNCHDLAPAGLNGQVQEHINMLRSIRGDGPYINHGIAVAESTLTAIMGRESAYSGQEITWDQIMASKQDLMPKAFDMDMKINPPPVPVPGIYKFI